MDEGLAEKALRLRAELIAAEKELCAAFCPPAKPSRKGQPWRDLGLGRAARSAVGRGEDVDARVLAERTGAQKHSARAALSEARAQQRAQPSAVEGLVC